MSHDSHSVEIARGSGVDAEVESRNPYIFVVGCPRSGTTLLQRMLNSHPLLAVANDTHFITRCLEKISPHSIPDAVAGKEIRLTQELAAGVRDYRRFPRLGLTDRQAEEAAEGSATYREYVSALYTRFAALSGKRLGGEKTPDYVRDLPVLHGLFPESRVVHIIRDGRDVALSLIEWARGKGPGKLELWDEEPLAVSALWWRWQVRAGREDGAHLGPERYMELVYQDLVREAEPQLRRICDFLGLPFSERMLQYHEGKVKSNPRLSAKSAWLPPTSGLRDWRTQMAAPDLELFEALAGDLLEELGLERAFRKVSIETSTRATRCRIWWDDWLERRRGKDLKRQRERSR